MAALKQEWEKHEKIFFGVLALSFLGTASALAADLPVRPITKAPPMVAPPATWTGFYVGANGGYGWTDKVILGDLDDNPTGTKMDGGFGGGQIGYNYQTGMFVFGIETDIQASDVGGSILDTNYGDTFSTKVDWFGTVRGRLGVAHDSWLAYVTGGFAYGRVVTDVPLSLLNGSPYNLDKVAGGYTLGGGVEVRLTPAWSVKAEYQYINLGKNDPTNPAGASFTSVLNREILEDTAFHAVRVGVNYHFDVP